MTPKNELLGGKWHELVIAQPPRHQAEEQAVRHLGDRIGYGRVMQLAEQIWSEKAKAEGMAGGEMTTGPCALTMEPCPHLGEDPRPDWFDVSGHCDWCCGAGRVTKRVAAEMRKGVLR